MAMDFDSVLSEPRSGRDRAVIIDHHDYAQSVFLRGQPVPWTDPVRYSNFVGQAQGLLNPDVTLLDLGRFHTACIAANEPLREVCGNADHELRLAGREHAICIGFVACHADEREVIGVPQPGENAARELAAVGDAPEAFTVEEQEPARLVRGQHVRDDAVDRGVAARLGSGEAARASVVPVTLG